MLKVTDLRIGQSLVIQKGDETIAWFKKVDGRSLYKWRRIHTKGKKIIRVSDDPRVGSAEDDELAFRLDSGFTVRK